MDRTVLKHMKGIIEKTEINGPLLFQFLKSEDLEKKSAAAEALKDYHLAERLRAIVDLRRDMVRKLASVYFSLRNLALDKTDLRDVISKRDDDRTLRDKYDGAVWGAIDLHIGASPEAMPRLLPIVLGNSYFQETAKKKGYNVTPDSAPNSEKNHKIISSFFYMEISRSEVKQKIMEAFIRSRHKALR